MGVENKYKSRDMVSLMAWDNRHRIFTGLLMLASSTMLLIPAGTHADESKEPYRVSRVSGPVKIDGVLDDAIWQQALSIAVDNEVTPGDNIPAVVKTESYIAYDSEQIYVGFYCHDPEPASIQAHNRSRDDLQGEDVVVVVLDTFNTGQEAYELMCNPLGIQMDLIENPDYTDWDGIWNSAGKIVADGYIVEIAIPFSSLRFQAGDGDQTWGFALVRKYPRETEHQFVNIQYDRNNGCKLCQLDKIVGFDGISRNNSE